MRGPGAFANARVIAGRPSEEPWAERANPAADGSALELDQRARAIKRSVDLLGALVLLLVLALPMALVAALVKLTSPGPVIFRQRRVGRDGKLFTILKFRTMYAETEREVQKLAHLNEVTEPLFKIRDDPRLTPVGRVLRRLSLDELPQLWNVLRGEMSLVGPRPALPDEVAQYTDQQMKRLQVAQGATGLWQVSGRSELTFEKMIALDLYYIEHWSPWLDLEILLATIPVMLTARGAY